jgi:7-cyano-7-deazaguanine reductase
MPRNELKGKRSTRVASRRIAPAKPPTLPSKTLQVFDNPHIEIDCIPAKLCVELKSLKLYMWSYRNEGAFHEKVTNTILDDIVRAIEPRFMRITARWYVRGGIYTTVVAEHRQKGWKQQEVIKLPPRPAQTPGSS